MCSYKTIPKLSCNCNHNKNKRIAQDHLWIFEKNQEWLTGGRRALLAQSSSYLHILVKPWGRKMKESVPLLVSRGYLTCTLYWSDTPFVLKCLPGSGSQRVTFTETLGTIALQRKSKQKAKKDTLIEMHSKGMLLFRGKKEKQMLHRKI